MQNKSKKFFIRCPGKELHNMSYIPYKSSKVKSDELYYVQLEKKASRLISSAIRNSQ